MRGVLIWFLAPAMGGLYLFTLAGMLAPYAPSFDLINHFRLHMLEASIGLLVLIAWARARILTWLAAALIVLNGALAAPAFLNAASGEETGGASLKIVLANIQGHGGRDADIADFLAREDPDLVIMLEADPVAEPMLTSLGERYPHRIGCIDNHHCRMVLLYKLELKEPRAAARTENGPPYIAAGMAAGGQSFTFVGVHLARPFDGPRNRQDMDALTGLLKRMSGPLVVAGDFNATPWSWRLYRMQAASGLERHRTLGATWPNIKPLFAQLLIDQVLVSPEISVLDAYSGPGIGSDHLPSVTRIALPPRH